MYYSDYEGDGGELHYRLRKQRPDLKFQGGPYFSKLSVRADQNFQRKFPSGTKYFRTKIPVTGYTKAHFHMGLTTLTSLGVCMRDPAKTYYNLAVSCDSRGREIRSLTCPQKVSTLVQAPGILVPHTCTVYCSHCHWLRVPTPPLPTYYIYWTYHVPSY